MYLTILVQLLQLFLFLFSLESIANANDSDYYQYADDWSKDSCSNVRRVCAIVIVTVCILINPVGIPLRTVSIVIAASSGTVLISTLRVVTHYIIMIRMIPKNRSLLFSIFLLLFLLLSEHILFEDLPKLLVLRRILVECLIAKIHILSGGLWPFMELSKFRDHDLFSNFEIAKRFLRSIQHKEAASNIIECCHCINWFNPQQSFSNLASF
jgi:hypothetical protein